MNDIFERTEQVIAEEIRPAIQRDGGTIQLIKIDEQGIAWVELKVPAQNVVLLLLR